jgi:hypothetical protein
VNIADGDALLHILSATDYVFDQPLTGGCYLLV